MSVIPDDIKRDVDAIVDRLELCGITVVFVAMDRSGRSQCVTTTPPGMVPQLLRVFADSIEAERGGPRETDEERNAEWSPLLPEKWSPRCP